MGDSASERRLAENEVFFRTPNQHVVEGLEELQHMAQAEGHLELLDQIDLPVQFRCECSDEKCTRRIEITPSKYRAIHQNSSQFMMYPGHNVPELERIVQSERDYIVVEKMVAPPSKANKLNPTDLDNR